MADCVLAFWSGPLPLHYTFIACIVGLINKRNAHARPAAQNTNMYIEIISLIELGK